MNMVSTLVRARAEKMPRRSFSCGPDTAGQMHAALLREVKKRQIPVLYGYQVVKLFTDEKRCKVGWITGALL